MTKTYTEEFKRDAVQLVETSGKPKTQVARELGVSESALYRWIEQYGTGQSQPATHSEGIRSRTEAPAAGE
jgi:transposase